MRRILALATLISAAAGAAHAQQCLSYSDGLGNTTLTCPDGRSGYVYTPPGGPPQGLIGGQPYTGLPSNLTSPLAQPGVPSATYVDPPPSRSIAFPPPAPPAAPSAGLTPQPGLTPLQRAYQEERLAQVSRERAARNKAAKQKPGKDPRDP